MKIPRITGYLIVFGLFVGIISLSIVNVSMAAVDDDEGMRFAMAMQAPGHDPVNFAGMALGGNCSLKGNTGGIETEILLISRTLYILTPAIKTAREIDNPPPPGRSDGGWSDWLAEPGRINPLAFYGLIGLADDVDGEILVGENDAIRLGFDDGTLVSIAFPNVSGGGTITYTYSDFESDDTISSGDFTIPDDYRRTD